MRHGTFPSPRYRVASRDAPLRKVSCSSLLPTSNVAASCSSRGATASSPHGVLPVVLNVVSQVFVPVLHVLHPTVRRLRGEPYTFALTGHSTTVPPPTLDFPRHVAIGEEFAQMVSRLLFLLLLPRRLLLLPQS